MTCLCDLKTPFGAPVVPDEHMITAIVDGVFERFGNLKIGKKIEVRLQNQSTF